MHTRPVNNHTVVLLTRKQLFAQTKLSDFCGIGPRIERRLNALGIYTPDELRAASQQELVVEFGRHSGTKLYHMGQGIDHSPLITQAELPPEKSFGHSYTLPKQMSSLADAWTVLARLSDQVARRMRKAGFLGRTLYCHMQFEDHPSIGGRLTRKIPIHDGRTIFRQTQSLLKSQLPSDTVHLLVRHVGVSLSNLVPTPTTLPLFPEDQRRAKITPVIDQLWDTYGSWSVVWADNLNSSRILESIPDGRTKRPMLREY